MGLRITQGLQSHIIPVKLIIVLLEVLLLTGRETEHGGVNALQQLENTFIVEIVVNTLHFLRLCYEEGKGMIDDKKNGNKLISRLKRMLILYKEEGPSDA